MKTNHLFDGITVATMSYGAGGAVEVGKRFGDVPQALQTDRSCLSGRYPDAISGSPLDACEIVRHRFEREDLQHLPELWQESLRLSVVKMPDDRVNEAFTRPLHSK